jgi:hypothetical protein
MVLAQKNGRSMAVLYGGSGLYEESSDITNEYLQGDTWILDMTLLEHGMSEIP